MRAFIEAGDNRPEELIDAGSRTEHPGMTTSLPGWLYRRPRAPRRQTPGEPDRRVVGSGLCRRPGANYSDARPAARSYGLPRAASAASATRRRSATRCRMSSSDMVVAPRPGRG
jgi:hypothetical protein